MSSSEYTGLCSICNRTQSCSLPRESTRSILECDEFEIQSLYRIPTFEFITDKILSDEPLAVEPVHSVETNQFKGLCCDCANRKTCTYPKVEGGIFHCEEYQ